MGNVRKHAKICLVIWLLLFSCVATAQNLAVPDNLMPPGEPSLAGPVYDSIFVADIIITGNKRTRKEIIQRELALVPGQRIATSNLTEYLEQEKNKVFNTDLFVTVDITPYPAGNDSVLVMVDLLERWYVIPVPLIDFGDRNFNEWWRDRDRDLGRLEYGFKFKDTNFRGRRESLKLNLLFGFTKNVSLDYRLPFINHNKTIGLDIGGSYSQNRDIAFKTTGNKLDFASADRLLIERYNAKLGLTRRSHFYNTHRVQAAYRNYHIDDSVALLNPDYLGNGLTRQHYFELTYSFTRDLRDITAYPLTGFYLSVLASKMGLGILNELDAGMLRAEYARFFDIGQNFYYSARFSGKTSYPQRQPYYLVQALGYSGDIVRGFDLYVIDGQHMLLMQNTLRKKLASGRQDISKVMPLKQFSVIPWALYVRAHFDTGRSWNSVFDPENTLLDGRTLHAAGLGLDLVTAYNAVIRVEYSRNDLGENNFFFHYSTSF